MRSLIVVLALLFEGGSGDVDVDKPEDFGAPTPESCPELPITWTGFGASVPNKRPAAVGDVSEVSACGELSSVVKDS
jgi:hypothetical protein